MTEYTGGQQKVADYFQHLLSSCEYVPAISFSSRTRWDSANPWYPAYQAAAVEFVPANYQYQFLAGLDWEQYLASSHPHKQPIINLIQHVRHANPDQRLFSFLSRPAIRICVSTEVAAAIESTGRVVGPVVTIANGLDLPALPQLEKRWDLLILGPKNPQLAAELMAELGQRNGRVRMVSNWLARSELLALMAASRIVLALPSPSEGFYLPALEAMQYAELAIVPDCVGNRSFCLHQENCLRPEYKRDAIMAALNEGLGLLQAPSVLSRIQAHAARTLNYHSLARERQEFLALMGRADDLWRSLC